MTAFRLDARARDLRRAVGPIAWFVFEELLLVSEEGSSDSLVAAASVRSVASSVSLNKDTVARALAMLARAGLVEPIPQPKRTGRFGGGAYRVHLPGGLRLERQSEDTVRSSLPRRRSAPRPAQPGAQLTLLELAASGEQLRSTVGGEDPGNPKPPDALAPAVSRPPRFATRDGGGKPHGRERRC